MTNAESGNNIFGSCLQIYFPNVYTWIYLFWAGDAHFFSYALVVYCYSINIWKENAVKF